VLVEVACGRSPFDPLPQLAQQQQELLTGGKPARHQPGGPLGRIPASEVLDHRLRMDGGFCVGGELAHRGRAPQSLCACLELVDDVLVAVALADSSLELGESVSVE